MYSDNYSKVVSRNYTQEAQVSDAGLPKSGNDLSYRSKSTGVIGRLIPYSYQDLIPGSKFSGKNTIGVTLEQMSTPIAPDMLLRTHQFAVYDFSVNRDFRDIMTANPSNNFNKDEVIGAFNPVTIVTKVMHNLHTALEASLLAAGNPSATVQQLSTGIFVSGSYSSEGIVHSSSLMTNYPNIYLEGAILDLKEQVDSRLNRVNGAVTIPSTVTALRENLYSIASAVIDFWFGQNSLFDAFGYPYISHSVLRSYCLGTSSYNPGSNFYNMWKMLTYDLNSSGLSTNEPFFSDSKLRKYQAIWIEFYRNVQIQKITNVLNYHKWDNSLSLGVGNDTSVPTEWQILMLIKRICSWNEDTFTSCQLDDIMRRIYLPVVIDTEISSSGNVVVSGNPNNEFNASPDASYGMSRFMTVQDITYKDSFGADKYITLPIPSILNRSIASLDYDFGNSMNVQGFDLFSLKRAQMLERFLKRNHYFGDDEYRDIIKGQYGVDVSDLRLNRPHFLGGDTVMMQLDQHISTAGEIGSAGSGTFGERVVTGNGHLEGNTFTDFAEEFGTVISLFSIIPDVQYDPLCIQNTQVYVSDFPVPVLCQNFEAIVPSMALARNKLFSSNIRDFGHAPSAYQYRSRVNEVHGKFLDEYSDFTCARFFGNSAETAPKLNSQFLECRPYLGFFVNKILLDEQFWYVADHEFYVENPLPAPVEVI